MKIAALIILLLAPTTVFAQNLQNINQGDMQKIMLQMQKMQQCMEKIDKSELQNFEKEAQETDAEIKALCEKGKRKKAQKRAIAFGKKVTKIKALQEIKECTELMKGFEGMFPANPQANRETDFSDHHVCDK